MFYLYIFLYSKIKTVLKNYLWKRLHLAIRRVLIHLLIFYGINISECVLSQVFFRRLRSSERWSNSTSSQIGVRRISTVETVCPRAEILLDADIRAGREDRSLYLPSSLLPPLPRLYRERTGRYPDRKHGPWTSPSFFSALSGGSERRISASRNRPGFRPPRLPHSDSLFFHSLFRVSLFLLFAFLSVSSSPLSRSASYLGFLPRSSPSLW